MDDRADEPDRWGYTPASAVGRGVFQALPAPSDDEVAEVLAQVHHRVLRLLPQRGRLAEPEASPSDPVAEQMPLLAGWAPPLALGRLTESSHGQLLYALACKRYARRVGNLYGFSARPCSQDEVSPEDMCVE